MMILGSALPPCFHLLAARHVETTPEVVVLAFRFVRITVAGQHRTFTGFVFMPSHPGERRLNRQFSIILLKSNEQDKTQNLLLLVQLLHKPEFSRNWVHSSTHNFPIIII